MKKLIFDLDGTLIDSMRYLEKAVIDLLEENNVKYPKDIMKIVTPLGDKATSKYFKEKLGFNLPEEVILERMRKYTYKEYAYNIPAKDGVIDVLTKLKQQGYSLNVLTASPHLILDVCLKRLGIYEIFDNVWSCNDFNTVKADVNIFIQVANKLNAKVEDCVMFDDNVIAVETAKKAGMKVVGVFDQSSAAFEEQIKELCDKYVYKLQEIFE